MKKEMSCLSEMCLDEFVRYISDKKIFCFGCGIQGKRMAGILYNWGIQNNLVAYIDNDEKKIGSEYICDGKAFKIVSIKEAIKCDDGNSIILITAIDYRSIYNQLSVYGYDMQRCISIDEIARNQLEISNYSDVIYESKDKLIPKKIHYAWFGKEKPNLIKKNIEHWKELCPDYEFYEWNDTNYDITKNKYMKEAYESKIWGFVPDYMRLDIIYKYGGIYLDTDIEMIKKPDELLYQKCFAFFNATFVMNLGSGFGAVAGMDIIKELRDYYDTVSFVNKDGTYNKTSCNSHSYNVMKKYGVKVNDRLQNVHGMNIYPMIFQGACGHTNTIHVTNKTFWIHYGNLSWMTRELKNEQ